MTTLSNAMTALKTHLAAIEISGASVFSDEAIYVTTEGHDAGITRYPRAVISIGDSDPHEEHSNALQRATITLRLETETHAGRTGEAAAFGGYGKSGLEQIRQAVIAATDVIGPHDSPPIAPGIVLDDGAAPIKENESLVWTTLTYTGFLEVG